MQQIGLINDHYLRKQDPLPASLLAAASICAMLEESIFELLQDRQLLPQSGKPSLLAVPSAEGVPLKPSRCLIRRGSFAACRRKYN